MKLSNCQLFFAFLRSRSCKTGEFNLAKWLKKLAKGKWYSHREKWEHPIGEGRGLCDHNFSLLIFWNSII